MEEGMIVVTFDELLDPRAAGKNARTPGALYHFLSVKRQGQGSGELYVSEDMWKRVASLGLKSGDQIALVYSLNKFRGQFEPRLVDVVAVETSVQKAS